MSKLWYKPVSLAASLTAGAVAGVVFKQAWKAVAGSKHAPDATDEQSGWGEVIASAALQGVIFAVTKAAFDRAGAAGIHRLTGVWPDKKK